MLNSTSAYDRLPVKYPALTPGEMEEFLDGKWIAHVTTVGGDGSPHVKPVWYTWDSGKIWIITWLKCKTVYNIEHEKRVAVNIHDAEQPVVGWPRRGCLINGHAELVPEMKNEIKPESWHFKIFARYIGEKACYELPAKEHLSNPNMAIGITPTKAVSWNYTKGTLNE